MNMLKRFGISAGVLVCAAALTQCNDTTTSPTDLNASADLSELPDLMPVGPTITMISPGSGANTGGGTITITGTGFQQGATVMIGGVAATNVVVVSATQITATVPAKPASCGPATVVVTNPNNQMATSANGFKYRSVMVSFGTPTSLAMPSNPRQVITVDLNNDMKLDLVTANSGNSSINVRLGNGDGTFGNAVNNSIGVGTQPYAVAAGDVNGDKILDLVTANNAGNNISLRIGVGDGTFTTPAPATFAAGAGPYDISLGDVKGA